MPGRPPLLHALGLVLLALAPAAGAPAQPPTDAHDDLSSSPARRLSSSACRHGAEGVLISLEPAAYSQSSNASARGARTRAFAASLLARGGSASASAGGNKGGSGSGSNTVRILHVFDRGLLDAVAAEIDDAATLTAVLADPEVRSIEENCIITLDDPSSGGSGKIKERMQRRMLQSTGVSTSSLQTNAPWGLDRIDSRSGTDGVYNHGAADGAAAAIYILDSGAC